MVILNHYAVRLLFKSFHNFRLGTDRAKDLKVKQLRF